MKLHVIDGIAVKTKGRLLKTARLQDEYYVPIENPDAFRQKLLASGVSADLFTCVQGVDEKEPKHPFYHELDELAVLPITTYEHWYKNQIGFKPRNKLKKSQKNGVEVRRVEFSDDLARRIMEVYNETPVRQGKRNFHYGKDFETIKREHRTFLDCSEFVGAFLGDQMIGFSKVTHVKSYSILMNIVAMVCQRDKAPTNALIAKVIELCAKRGSRCLNYSIWGRQGLNEFKAANGFERVEIPRYFIPLTLKGTLALRLKLHRRLAQYLPEKMIVKGADLRARWTEFKYGRHTLGQQTVAPVASAD